MFYKRKGEISLTVNVDKMLKLGRQKQCQKMTPSKFLLMERAIKALKSRNIERKKDGTNDDNADDDDDYDGDDDGGK